MQNNIFCIGGFNLNIHPFIKSELNEEQLKAVVQMNNCVVAAGAGSGKTRVLAFRYAHLVIEHGFEVSSILTLTFTKKATAEMYDRIYSTLKTISESKDSSSIQTKRAKDAIESFHTARIQTIDSFCSSIVRIASKEYGIRPDFIIDNEGVKEFSTKLALDYLLKHRNNPSMQELMGMEKFENMVEALFVNPLAYSNIATTIDFSQYIDAQIEIILSEWKKHIQNVFTNRHEFESSNPETINIFIKVDTYFIDDITIRKYISLLRDTTKTYTERLTHLEELKKSIIPFLKAINELSTLPKNKTENKQIKNEIDLMRDSYSTLTALSQYILCFTQSMDILPILQCYQNEITEWKRTSGKLTYSDISSLALRILVENPDIRKNEKVKTNAIMIDEFQDNNAMQKDMLFLLAEKIERKESSIPTAQELLPQKLFFVGDEKQSIYKFRGADVSVFRELKNNLSETLSMSTNYRSHPQLIASFNSIFGAYTYLGAKYAFDTTQELKIAENAPSVFLQEYQLEKEQALPIFEAEYTNIFSDTLDDDTIEDRRIHICLLDNTKMKTGTEKSDSSDSDNETEKEDNFIESENIAIFTAEKIAELCKLGHKPKDFAILFRSYSKQHLYEKHLRRLGIPYIAENITNFFGDAPVNDLLSLIRLIVYPKDTLSFSSVLCSPFVGLEQKEALYCLMKVSQAEKKDLLFCKEYADFFEDSSKDKYLKAQCSYEELRERAHIASCSDIVRDLWYKAGYRYETMWNEDVTLFAETYDFLFDIARKIDLEGKNLTYFIDYLYDLEKNSERLDDMNIPLERQGAVQLMSIHKSKGLEFPIVFIAGMSSRGRSAKNTDKVYIDKTYGLSLNFPVCSEIKECKKNFFYNNAKILENQMEEAELRRVLYVAMTRAKKELYITGSYTINKVVQGNLKKVGIIDADIENESNMPLILTEIFKEKVKNKKEQNETQVQYNFCVQNNTLFSFLLPVIVYYKDKNAPFTLEKIDSKTRDTLQKSDSLRKKASKNESQKARLPVYEGASIISTPILEQPYISPSHLGHSKDILKSSDNADLGETAIKELDDIIASKKEEAFSYSHFGTICHLYCESAFTHKDPTIPSEIVNALSTAELAVVCSIAQKMAFDFSQSPIGKEALASNWQKTEHDFKLILRNEVGKTVIMKGQIDLLFERSDGSLVIVDYKTDSVENPSTHFVQLNAYRKAVSKIFNKNVLDISCILYYLRTGNINEVSSDLNTIDLNSIVFK